MFVKYLCLGCGITWRSEGIVAICPVCKSKAIKLKEEVDTKEVKDKLSTKKNTK